ncbi:MAG: hypothetical protein AAF585_28985, partial [Verrucomicrobiota bacterium]
MARKPLNSRQRRRRRIIFWISTVVVLIAAAFVTIEFELAHKVKDQFDIRTARRHAENARLHAEKGEWNDARRLALTAHMLDPTSLDASRLLFDAATRTEWDQTQLIAVHRFLHEDSTMDDKLTVLNYFYQLGEARYFAGLHDKLTDEEKADQRTLFLHARFLASNGAAPQAEAIVREQLQKNPEDGQFRGMLASVLLLPGQSE